MVLLCFPINHVKCCAKRAVGAVKHLAWYRGGKLPEMGEKAKKDGIKNESVIEVCMLTHPQCSMGTY